MSAGAATAGPPLWLSLSLDRLRAALRGGGAGAAAAVRVAAQPVRAAVDVVYRAAPLPLLLDRAFWRELRELCERIVREALRVALDFVRRAKAGVVVSPH